MNLEKTLVTNIEDNKELVEFLNLFLTIKDVKLLKDFNSSDYFELDYIAVLSGNNPLNYSNYGESIHPSIKEYEDYKLEFKFLRNLRNSNLNPPVIGIGYGAHVLTINNNESIIQKVNGHGIGHRCHFHGGLGSLDYFDSKGEHSQMMLIKGRENEDKEIIAWSKRFLSDTYLNGNSKEINLPERFLEPEIVKFKNQLAIQSEITEDFKNNIDNTRKIITIIKKTLNFK